MTQTLQEFSAAADFVRKAFPSADQRANLLAGFAPFLLKSPNFIPKPSRLDEILPGDGSVQLSLEPLQRIYINRRLSVGRCIVNVHRLFPLPVTCFFNLSATVPLRQVVEVGFTGL